MPHSSGGGSSGGGFHSGSSSGSTNPNRISRRPFPGASRYVYYDAYGTAQFLYCAGDPVKNKKRTLLSLVLFGVLTLVPIGIVLGTGLHNPKRISTSYNTNIVIKDDRNVLSGAETAELQDTFHLFFDYSGVTPAFQSVDNSLWHSHYASLSGYAYDSYLSLFSDESHWLIVYSSDADGRTNWAFEGMQGNDTDPVITKYLADRFNESMQTMLSDSANSVGKSLKASLEKTYPLLRETYFYVEPNMWIFMGIWELAMVCLIVASVMELQRAKLFAGAKKLEGEPGKVHCPNCHQEYYEGVIEYCPKCACKLEKE